MGAEAPEIVPAFRRITRTLHRVGSLTQLRNLHTVRASAESSEFRLLTLWLVKLVERTGPLYSYVREQVLPVG